MMKRYKWNIVIVLIAIVGLSVMLYPNFSNYWNRKNQSKAVASYQKELSGVAAEDYEEMWEDAQSYNEALRKLDFPLRNFDLVDGYEEILDVSGTGIMGYLSIEEIGLEYPVYHGTSDGVLQIAVGHVQGSSFPTGGKGSHVVLSAHNGLADAELFTNLDQLKMGDTFSITVLDRILTYQVDQILVVEPDDLSEIRIDEEQDYCTLVTCTPFGVNSHRLLVRGTRVGIEENPLILSADADQVNTDVVALGIFIVLLILMVPGYFLYRRFKHSKKQA